LELARKDPPDLILLDIKLPDINGDEVLRNLRSDSRTKLIPVIFVTGDGEQDSVVNRLSMGADDYLSKPFSSRELNARIQSVLRRCFVNLDANPLSHLPGNAVIERELQQMIERGHPFAALYVDINEFKAYNDYYGFYRGDAVIRKTADLLRELNMEGKVLVGHIGGDDFVLITQDPDVEGLCQRILTAFERIRNSFYDEKDRAAGFILVHDRRGAQRMFSPLSVSIGVVSNRVRPLRSIGEVATIGAEVKGVAKRMGGSAYFIDKRKDVYDAPQKIKTNSFTLGAITERLIAPFRRREKNSVPAAPPPHL
jgi:diguanylate cyclase (GGDEF)-like protein